MFSATVVFCPVSSVGISIRRNNTGKQVNKYNVPYRMCLKVYVKKKKKKKKKKYFDLTPIWTRTKTRVHVGERPNTKKTIIYKNQIKNIKLKISI